MSSVETIEGDSKRGNLGRVAYVGVCFMMLFTAFISAQNLVTQIYNEFNYTGLGPACVFTIYGLQGTGSIFASYVKRSISHRQGFVFGVLGYATFILVGAFTTSCHQFDLEFALCKRAPIEILNIVSSFFVGLGAAILWLTQSDYVNVCADERTKGLFNSVFWTLMQLSQIIGSVMATFVLGNTNQFVFYMILLAFSTIAVAMFSFTPHIPISESSESKIQEPRETLSDSLKKIWAAVLFKDSRFMLIPMTFIGIVIAFYASFLSTVVDATVKSGDDNVVNERMGFVLIALAAGEVSAGLSVGRLADVVNKFKLLHVVMVLPELALVLSFIAYQTGSYPLAVLSGFVWGFSDTALNSMMTTMIGAFFGGTLELYCLMRCLTGYGAVYGSVLALVLSSHAVVYAAIIFGTLIVFHTIFILLQPKNLIKVQENESLVRTKL